MTVNPDESSHVKWHHSEEGDFPRPCRCLKFKDHTCEGCRQWCGLQPDYDAPYVDWRNTLSLEDLLYEELREVRGVGNKMAERIAWWLPQTWWYRRVTLNECPDDGDHIPCEVEECTCQCHRAQLEGLLADAQNKIKELESREDS